MQILPQNISSFSKMKFVKRINSFDVGIEDMGKTFSAYIDKLHKVANTDILVKLLMANPSDPETSEDKDTDEDKQKTATTPSTKGFVTKDISEHANDSKAIANGLQNHFISAKNDDFLDQDRPLTGVEIDSNNSHTPLPSSDLSIDARACKAPKRQKPKGSLSNKEKVETFVSAKGLLKGSQYEEEKKMKGKADNVKNEKTNDSQGIEKFIKHLLEPQVSNIKYFDAAIVYDKNDYVEVTDFKETLVHIAKSALKEDLRIELFDSEEFSQSKIMVVEDVLKRCSIVFVYLTSNFTSAELNLFIEEAIGISRFGLGSENGGCQNPWILKPVHTKSRKSRNYKTPVGLLTVNGIDWFDKNSSHTINNIIELLKTAVTQRKQRTTESYTSNYYTSMFGNAIEVPHLGPPFNKPLGSQMNVQTHPRNDPYTSQFSQDLMSLPPSSFSSQALGNYTADIRTDTQASCFPSFQDTSYSNAREFHSSQQFSNMYQPGDSLTHMRFVSCPYQIPPPPYSSIPSHEQFRQPSVDERQFEQVISTAPFEFAQQTTGQYQAPRQLPNFQAAAMSQTQSPVQSPQITRRIPQADTLNRPQSNTDLQRQNSNGSNLSIYRHISQDSPHSQSDNLVVDQSDDTKPSSRLDDISHLPRDLITKTNLSADDDVEVDNNSMVNYDGDNRTEHLQNEDQYDESEESSTEPECSSDSDCESFTGARVFKKVVKIYGCKTVQLGESNLVKEVDRRPEQINRKMKLELLDENRKQEKHFLSSQNNVSTELPQNCLSKSEMNISVTEDNMSTENTLTEVLRGKAKSFSPEESAYCDYTANMYTSNMAKSSSSSKESSFDKSKAHLKVSLNSNDLTDNLSSKVPTVFSPDNNITEDQLFGSGSISSKSTSLRSVSSTPEAPFCFSQGIQQNRSLRNILQTLCVDRGMNSNGDDPSVNADDID